MRAGEGAAVFFLVLSSFAASVVAPTKSELEAMYAAAAQELNAGHNREALAKLDAIEARQPDVAAAENLRGVAWMRLTEYRKAEAALRKAREIDPDFWEARFNLAEVSFLTENWTEARRRFSALLAEPNEHLQGATTDLVRFKIVLTCLLEGKEKLAAPFLEKLQSAAESPALYYAKAALALRQKDQHEAKGWMATAAKEFSPQLNKLFTESFYEVGWLPKPEGTTPVVLDVTSPAERAGHAQADLKRAERAYGARDLEGASQLLDEVDAIAPNQAVSLNLRGEILLDQGKIDEAEKALRDALAINPQLIPARYNLARVPLARKDYGTARKELEALLGAISGGKEAEREQLIRYQIFLTLLLEGREGAAQKAMDEFKMMDGSPALYYAQAAWAFQHGNARQGKNWVANASNMFSAESNRAFAASFSDLGWMNNGATPAPSVTPAPVVAQNTESEPPGPTASASPAQPIASPPPVIAQTEPAESPAPTPEVSPTPEKVARAEKERNEEPTRREKKRSAEKKSRDEEEITTRVRVRKALPVYTPTPAASPAIASVPPIAEPVSSPTHENLGDKIRNIFFRPRQPETAPAPPSATSAVVPNPSASPALSPRGGLGN